jgi:trimethylamine--corrinoid protein Co-methyltransferase
LARFYELPCRGTGGNSDSKLVDVQAGIETTLSLMHAAYAGMNFIYDSAGSLDGSITTSYEKIVVDNELCGMVARTLRGIRVTRESLAVDEILKAGPAASYLSSAHTLKSFREEHYLPALLDRRPRDAWEAAGGKDLALVARERARAILKEHRPEQLDKSVVTDGEAYIKKAAKAWAR